MITKAKIEYVKKHHDNKITRISKGPKKGRWHTYYGHGKNRVEVTSSTEDLLLLSLYEKYYSKECTNNLITFEKVFLELKQSKLKYDNVTNQTVKLMDDMFNKYLVSIASKEISLITSDDLKELYLDIVKTYKPKKERLKRIHQLVNEIFRFGLDKGFVTSIPSIGIDISRYYKDCDTKKRPVEAMQFSKEQIDILRQYALSNTSNPRALMMLLASKTGMRAGELSALKWIDISTERINICRQQVIRGKTLEITNYTKDERLNPNGGRFFPITNEIRLIFDLIRNSIGVKGEFVFHDESGNMIAKNSYELYLKRVCKRLFTDRFKVFPTNNHAFRKALNASMAENGIGLMTRAALLGHSPETNEKNYLIGDNRMIDKNICSQLDGNAVNDICSQIGKSSHKNSSRILVFRPAAALWDGRGSNP